MVLWIKRKWFVWSHVACRPRLCTGLHTDVGAGHRCLLVWPAPASSSACCPDVVPGLAAGPAGQSERLSARRGWALLFLAPRERRRPSDGSGAPLAALAVDSSGGRGAAGPGGARPACLHQQLGCAGPGGAAAGPQAGPEAWIPQPWAGALAGAAGCEAQDEERRLRGARGPQVPSAVVPVQREPERPECAGGLGAGLHRQGRGRLHLGRWH
nr:uncharacterized protein LOC102460552 isoform X1 [Pelodiscus sinensis]|eukprot:XP_025034004.1 uncharacterized protein LOC102460552 isoform X1 [Pelodiscus sinensis]